MSRVRRSVWAAALLGLLGALPAHAAQFQVQTVDSLGSDRGVHSSLALDTHGQPHISYYGDNQLLYASKHDSTWSYETVDSDVGYYTSLALDSSDVPHICYFDSTRADVRYATKAPGYWVTELVDSAGSVGQYATIALDPSGRPAIAYCDFTNGDLKYAIRDNGAWSIEVADSVGVVGYYTSLAFDRAGQACVSYLNLAGGLKFARRTPSGWVAVNVELGGNLGSFSSLALDTLGFGHISYADLDAHSLRYAEETPLGWFKQTVDPSNGAGPYTSLRLDAGMNPRISYIAAGTKRLNYAERSGFLWTFQVVDPSVQVTHFNSLRLDASGNPVISYYDELRSNLKIADASIHLIEPQGGEFWAAGSAQNVVWTGVGPVDVYLSQDNGLSYTKVTSTPDPYHIIPITAPAWSSGTVRLKVVRDSIPAVSETSRTLSIAPGLSSPWWTKLVDGTGLTGFTPSMQVSSSGSPRITYWDTTNGAVRYASRSAGAWTPETVRSGLGSHTDAPLAVDPTGAPTVAFFDNTAHRLMWARRANGAWASEIAVPLLATAEHCALALDRYGMPRIAYYEPVPGRLVLAARFGISWATETVETGDGVGFWNALALDTLGYPYLAYYDANAGDLKFASKTGAAWTIEVVDQVGDVGAHTALALDRNAEPHVSYVDVSNGYLKYARRSGGAWIIQTVDGSGRVGGATSITLDASGEPRIAYHDRVRRKLLVATHSGASWILETVTPALNAGSMSSLALGPDGNARVAYLDDIQNDLRYASSSIELNELPPATRWPVGAHRTVAWDGNGAVSLSLSRDAGATFNLLASGLTGPSTTLIVPGPSTPNAVLRLDRSLPLSFSVSDTFAIAAGVDLLSFRADQIPFGTGADVTWQTDPTVPDLAGYRLERALGGAAYTTLFALTTSTAYLDPAATAGTTYRLTAINGGGGEFALGEATFLPRKPLAAGPLPYRRGALAITFAVAAGAPGGSRSEIRLYDVRGRLVRTIVNGPVAAGFQSAAWDGTDDRGRRVASGLYVLKSVSGGHETSLKIAVVR